jgi:para-nitrobenzyl esterase
VASVLADLIRPGGAGNAPVFREVTTSYGVLQGISAGPVVSFKGIPYAASTAGANRFLPPQKPEAWTGVREAFAQSVVCPQQPTDPRGDYGRTIYWDINPGGYGEDCLSLNVWTPGTDDVKRPVLVSFHGGGFVTGSGNNVGYDGAELALWGDVVVATVNHRLGAFGYTNLTGAGAPEEFRYAGVAGLLDLVAALEWVQTNIAGFGGDPSRVMIFGQSGGGAKTSALLAMPPAAGLFQRAAVQSGSSVRLGTPEGGTEVAEKLLGELGLSRNNIAQIQSLPWQQVLEAQIRVGAMRFTPTIGTDALPHHPFDPEAPPESADIPLIVSSTLEDAALVLTKHDIDETTLQAALVERFGDLAWEIHELYRRDDPDRPAHLVLSQVLTDAGFRRGLYTQAERKSQQGGAPVWVYQWDWPTPAYGGKFGAIHGIDVAASFHAVRDTFFAGQSEGRLMADRLASAWVAFAATGDPNNDLLPQWPAYDTKRRATMVFDTDTRVVKNPRRTIREFWEKMPPPATPIGSGSNSTGSSSTRPRRARAKATPLPPERAGRGSDRRDPEAIHPFVC